MDIKSLFIILFGDNSLSNTLIQEGPYSKLNEEEFYDAVETALDREDEESELVCN